MSPLNSQPEYSPWLHRIALLTAAVTLLLIYVGGQVTTRQAGMSVPDWPNSYGYNMFLFPINRWVGGIFYEHSHRLLATVVGFLSISMTLMAWGPAATIAGRRKIAQISKTSAAMALISIITEIAIKFLQPAGLLAKIFPQLIVAFAGILAVAAVAWFARSPESRRWVRWLTTAVLLGVIFQGVLGGLRVVLVKLDLAIVHGCVAQAFFCLASLLVLVTSRWWIDAPNLCYAGNAKAGRRLIALAVTCFCVVYLQLIIGAVMRHYQAGLAIPDLPLAYHHILPPTNQTELDAANRLRIWQLNLPPVTLSQIWLHFSHRLGACIVTLAVIFLSGAILGRHRRHPALFRPALILLLLLITQITLGILTVYLRKPADITSAHVAVGASVLVTAFIIAVRAMRLYSLSFRAADLANPWAAATPGAASAHPLAT
jgi:heme a synthase